MKHGSSERTQVSDVLTSLLSGNENLVGLMGFVPAAYFVSCVVVLLIVKPN